MRIKRTACLVFCCAMLSTRLFAQQAAPLLSLKDAVEIALKNNYNIKLSKNNATIASNNVTLGNAGILPQVSGNFAANGATQTSEQIRTDGTVVNNHDAVSSNNSTGINLKWTVFDGFAMFANYDQLKQLNQLGSLRLQDTVQRTIASVITTYYDLVSQNEQIKALKGAIDISRTQLRYANDKFTVGRASKLDVLNAEVNLNTDTGNLITQYQQFKAIKIQLNQLLIRDLQTDFSVTDTILVDNKLILADIINNAQLQNPTILSAQLNQRLAEINLRQVQASRYPQIGITSGYGFTNNTTPVSVVTLGQTTHGHGPNYGVTASINIFGAFNQNRRERNAKIQIDNAEISAKQAKLDIEAQINSFFVSYLTGLDLVKLGQANVVLAKKNLDITLDKYKLGNITPLEVREAQRNYLDAESKFYDAQYQSKQAEITLKQITNSISIQ